MAKKDESEDVPADADEEVKGAPELEEEPGEETTPDPLDETPPEEPAEEPEEKPEPKDSEETSRLLEAKARDRSGDNVFKRFGHWYKTHKKLSIPLTVVAILVLILALPATRYQALGLFIKKNFSVTVLDTESSKPISGASVTLAGKTAETDAEGKATITEVKPGDAELKVTKKYYEDSSANVLVSLSDGENNKEMKLKATGRQVPVTVKHKITGAAVSGATVKALDTESKTNEKGEAVMVLPADQQKVNATISAQGFNDTKANLVVTEEAGKNDFALVPSGRVFFLSKASGKLDIVSTNLDGTDRKTVLAGTGKEQDYNTTLVPTADWKYLLLNARRDSELNKLYLINTATSELSVIDEGDATFDVGGWIDHTLAYTVNRNNVGEGSPKAQAIKLYDAPSKNLKVVDETDAVRSSVVNGRANKWGFERYGWATVVGDKYVYSKSWVAAARFAYGGKNFLQLKDKKFQVVEVSTNGSKNVVKSIPLPTTVTTPYNLQRFQPVYSYQLFPNKPKELFFNIEGAKKQGEEAFFAYTPGSVAESEAAENFFANPESKSFSLSPSGKQTLWTESRDGKTVFFIGDANGNNEKRITSLGEYSRYGWWTDDYLLVAKGNELFIVSKNGKPAPIKISNFHVLGGYYRG